MTGRASYNSEDVAPGRQKDLGAFAAMITNRPQGPVPGLFDRQSINLIIGTSGTAKSPFLLHQLEKYISGGGFLDYAGCSDGPVQMGLIGCAGTEGKIHNDLAAFPLLNDQSKFPFEMWKPNESETEFDALTRTYETLNSLLPAAQRPIKLLIIDDFQSLMTAGDVSKIKYVKDFCRAVHEFCRKQDVTIIGTTGSGKAKTHECYPQMADRIPGANCWGAEMDSLIVLELIDLHKQPEGRTETRRIIVKTRSAPIAVHFAGFVDGRLEVSPSFIPVAEPSPEQTRLEANIAALKSTDVLRREDIVRWCVEAGMTDSMIERWIADQVKDGVLVREGKANRTRYRRPYAQ